jgi:hypothetical protein
MAIGRLMKKKMVPISLARQINGLDIPASPKPLHRAKKRRLASTYRANNRAERMANKVAARAARRPALICS